MIPTGTFRSIQGSRIRHRHNPPSGSVRRCPAAALLPALIQPKDQARLLYPGRAACNETTLDQEAIKKGIYFSRNSRATERYRSDIVVADPVTGEIKKKVHNPYPDVSGALTTAGGLVFTGYADGTLAAYDDTSLDQLWKINVGSGFNAPPMTFEVGGKQYVAILTGLSRQSRNKLVLSPELGEMRNQTMLFVFGL